MPVRNTYIIIAVMVISVACYLKSVRTKFAMPVGDAITMIGQYYVDPVDQRELLEGAMQGMVSQLDPYSQFINPESFGHFQDALQQRFAGIGIIVEQPEGVGRVRVVTPLLDTPAFRAGLKPGDLIMNVDGVDTEGMTISDVSDMLRGPEGTEVKIQLQRKEQELIDVEVMRAWIPLESVLGDYRDTDNAWVFRLQEHPEIAYMRISTFGEQTVDEVTQVLQDLDNDFEALIVDLRQNQGGLLQAAVEISDMFLNEGTIVTTRGRGGVLEEEFFASKGMLVDQEIPMVILVDGDSASASEIVSACLKDHERCVIAGERSFGKGTVQNVLPLEAGRSALKLTTARYFRPSGKNIHRVKDASEDDAWGVRPSEGLEVTLEDEQRKELLGLLQRATYPVIDEGDDTSEAETDNSDSPPQERLEIDLQLRKAVEFLLQKQEKVETEAA